MSNNDTSKHTVTDGAELWAVPLCNVDGTYIADFKPRTWNVQVQFQKLRSLALTKDDVLLLAYPKSGFHWVWEIVYRIQCGTVTIPREKHMEQYFLDHLPVKILSVAEPPRVFVSHLPLKQLPVSLVTSQCPIIFLLRDPRAIAVSMYHHLTKMMQNASKFIGTWEDFLKLFLRESVLYNGWFTHTKQWEVDLRRLREQGHRVLVVHYEDLMQNPVEEVKRMGEFLGKKFSEEFYSEIVKETSIAALKERRKEQDFVVRRFFTNKEYPFYRKGVIDDWKSKFTVEQNETFLNMFYRLMKDSSVKLKCML